MRKHVPQEKRHLPALLPAGRNGGCIECEDTCDLLMTAASGARFLFYVSNCCTGNWPVQLKLSCEHGDIEMNGSVVTVRRDDGSSVTEDFTDHSVYGKDYWGKGHIMLIRDFYRCIQAGAKFPIDASEAMKTALLLEQANTQHAGDCIPPAEYD